MIEKTINEYFTIDIFHELFARYLSDRTGFLRQVHPFWRDVIDDLRMPSKSYSGFLVESDDLIEWAKINNMSISTNTLIKNTRNLNCDPVRLFDKPFPMILPEILYNYLHHQKGDNGIQILEYLLTNYPETKLLIRKSNYWKILVNVLLFASDDVLFHWFLQNSQDVFGIELNDKNLLKLIPTYTFASLNKFITIDFNRNISERIVRTLLKFPVLLQLEVSSFLFGCQFLITFEQINLLIAYIEENNFPDQFFVTHFFKFCFPSEQMNDISHALFDHNLVNLKKLINDFQSLPISNSLELILDDLIGYSISTQWIEGTEYFLSLRETSLDKCIIDLCVTQRFINKPLTEQFWHFIESKFSLKHQQEILAAFLQKDSLTDNSMMKLCNLTKSLKIHLIGCLNFDTLIYVIEFDVSVLLCNWTDDFNNIVSLLPHYTDDESILNECKVVLCHVFQKLMIFKKYQSTCFADLPLSTIVVNLILLTDLSKRYHHKFQKSCAETLINFFNVQKNSVLLNDTLSLSNSDFLPILLPYLRINFESIKLFAQILTPESLSKLWECCDETFDNEMIDFFFRPEHLTFDLINWFKSRKLIPPSRQILENIIMCYLDQNRLESFFIDFKYELTLCNNLLFEKNFKPTNLHLSPQMLKCMKHSGFISNNLLNYYDDISE